MPMYEYRCQDCGSRFEKLVWGNNKVRCPECGTGKIKRLFSTFGVKSSGKFTASSGRSCDTCRATSCGGCKG